MLMLVAGLVCIQAGVRNRQLPKSAPGLKERTKTLVHRVMLQPQGLSGNYRTYFRFSTPTLKRNFPK